MPTNLEKLQRDKYIAEHFYPPHQQPTACMGCVKYIGERYAESFTQWCQHYMITLPPEDCIFKVEE